MEQDVAILLCCTAAFQMQTSSTGTGSGRSPMPSSLWRWSPSWQRGEIFPQDGPEVFLTPDKQQNQSVVHV